MEEAITFACQECGKGLTLPGDRGGHVETCPHCGSYVNVPRESDPALVSESQFAAKAGQQTRRIANSRTPAQLWIELSAVLCVAYLPAMYASLSALFRSGPTGDYLFGHTLYHVVRAVEVSAPVLVIMALSGDPWCLFGIVRPQWIMDFTLACAIWCGDRMAYGMVVSLLPPSLWERSAALPDAHHAVPGGIPSYFLLLAVCIMSGFAEELVMRGYLIPRLERLLRSTWIAVIITSVLFGSYHLYQGIMPAAMIVVNGLVFAISFCWCRRLWPLCLAHAMHNFLLYV